MNTATAKKRWVLCVSVTLLMAILGGLAGCLSAPQTSQGDLTPIVSGSATSPEMGGGSSVATQTMPDPIATSGSEQGTAFPLTETIDPNRQAYEEYATQVAAGGGMTLVPYDTAVSVETAYQLELTSYAESLFTPTPFGPLPFPGTRLTDEELAERGWPRIGAGGVRNEDYHTTAIWLDKEYVDAEIFSKYQALFDLLAFRDGPPGVDFEARLGDLMVPNGQDAHLLNSALSEDVDNRLLADCTYESTIKNAMGLVESGKYVTFEPEQAGRRMGWEWGNRIPLLEVLTDKAIAFQVGNNYVVLLDTVLVNPNGVVNSLSVHFQSRSTANQRPIGTWYENLDPTRSDANAMMVWQPDVEEWRAFVFGSPYCEGYYPATIQK